MHEAVNLTGVLTRWEMELFRLYPGILLSMSASEYERTEQPYDKSKSEF